MVSKLAFEGLGLYGLKFSGTAPELSTGGSFGKCWTHETGGIFLYKRGSEGAANAGLEPYGEVLASEIAAHLCEHSVRYDLSRIHGQTASKCSLFTSEDTGYLPIAVIPGIDASPDGLMQYYNSIGEENMFRRMCVLDAVTLNTDRHLYNHGVLINNDTLEVVSAAPVFDLNMAFVPRLSIDDLRAFGRYAPEINGCIGEDLTQTAKALLTSEIKSEFINLSHYEFTFRGDESFPTERVKALEQLMTRHIDCLLDRHTIYLTEVFPDYEKDTLVRISEDLKRKIRPNYTNVQLDDRRELCMQVEYRIYQGFPRT